MKPKRVDFYLVSSEQTKDCLLVACRLLEKAYLRGHRIFVHCDNEALAHTLDELLWSFKEDSFIPHNLHGEGPEPPPAVQIAFQNEPRGYNDILLNLSQGIPNFHTRFQRIIEIVSDNAEQKELGRQRFRQYRHLHYELHTHNVNSSLPA